MYVYTDEGTVRYHHPGHKFLIARQDNITTTPNTSSNNILSTTWGKAIIIIVAALVGLALLLAYYSHLRRQRLNHKIPKYIPGAYLKRKWMAWKPRGKYSTLDDLEEPTSRRPSTQVRQSTVPAAVAAERHTSVRSIISLPAYSRTPKESEEVIGREGERGGIDTVVEFPETVEEQEEAREEEMESLYQIRQTRRQEISERDERRRQRREAREAGDFARLEELRRDSRLRREQNHSRDGSTVNLTAEMMIQEHNARGRSRRISSVSYAALGEVRHDGSRVRATSRDSERGGLLGQAAPMGGVPPLPHSRHGSEATSLLSMNTAHGLMGRHRSDSGAQSLSSVASSFEDVSRTETRPSVTGNASTSHNTANSIASSGSEEADIVDEQVEPLPIQPGSTPLPPTYDAHDWGDAPAYEEEQRRLSRLLSSASQRQRQGQPSSPADGRAPQLPSLHVTPTIHIESPTQPNSPAVNRGPEFSPITRDDPELR